MGPSVEALKERAGGGILLSPGYGTFARELLSLGLVDEIQFSISPLAWGEGEPPRLAESSVKLELLRATLSYRRRDPVVPAGLSI